MSVALTVQGSWRRRFRHVCRRRFAPSAPTALALPARLPTNWPAASLPLLAGRFAQQQNQRQNKKCKAADKSVRSAQPALCVRLSPRRPPVHTSKVKSCVSLAPAAVLAYNTAHVIPRCALLRLLRGTRLPLLYIFDCRSKHGRRSTTAISDTRCAAGAESAECGCR